MNFFKCFLFIVLIDVAYKVHALSDVNRKFVLDRHNWRRSQCANGQTQNKTGMLPTAKNMFTMFYDQTVETDAQNWANNCTFSHSAWHGNGENICTLSYIETYVAKAFDICCDAWWNEAATYGVPSDLVLTETNWYPTGHFSQMAWWNTNKLGCGLAYCSGRTYIVCQYNPPGNYMGQKIYESGAVCSGCPNPNDGNFHCQYGLCI
ncbi:hypothetical protein ACQ4LE_006082 [Meloidogyne hapla]